MIEMKYNVKETGLLNVPKTETDLGLTKWRNTQGLKSVLPKDVFY